MKYFGKILVTGIFVDVIIVILLGIYIAIAERNLESFFYFMLVFIGGLIAPIMLATTAHLGIQELILKKKNALNRFLEMCLLFLTIQFGIIAWSIIDVLLFYKSISALTFEKISSSLFDANFESYQIFGLTMTILIPLVSHYVTKFKLAE